MKQVGIKIENKGRYNYYFSSYRVEEVLRELVGTLKEGEAIEIKCGKGHHWIDYDEEAFGAEYPYSYEIKRVMYYVKEYIGQY